MGSASEVGKQVQPCGLCPQPLGSDVRPQGTQLVWQNCLMCRKTHTSGITVTCLRVKEKSQDCFSKTPGESQIRPHSPVSGFLSHTRFYPVPSHSTFSRCKRTAHSGVPCSPDSSAKQAPEQLIIHVLTCCRGEQLIIHVLNVLQRRVTRGQEGRIGSVWFTKLCPSTPLLLLATELDRPNLTQRKTSPVIQRERPAISVKPLQPWYSTLESEGSKHLSKESVEPLLLY